MFSPRPLSLCLNSHLFWQDVMCNVDRICELIKGTKQVSFFTASPHSTVAQFPAGQSHLVLLQLEPKNRRNKASSARLRLGLPDTKPGHVRRASPAWISSSSPNILLTESCMTR